jgi:hypothetical protein
MRIERDLSYFDTEDEAIDVAQQWAGRQRPDVQREQRTQHFI